MKRSPRFFILILCGLMVFIAGWSIVKLSHEGGTAAEHWSAGSKAAHSSHPNTGSAEANGLTFASGLYREDAMPVGLTSIDGSGGSGYDRAVKKNGVWYPVYSKAVKNPDGSPALTVIPLAIASGPLPIGRVGEPYSYSSEAIGGVPPYQWSAVGDAPPGGFTLDAQTGILAGRINEPVRRSLVLAVTDAVNERTTATMQLVIRPVGELAIVTKDLPIARIDESYSANLVATGGVPPYVWSMVGDLPSGLLLDGSTGIISGRPEEAGDLLYEATVTDAHGLTATTDLTLTAVDSLVIVTHASLPPAAPGKPYDFAFEAEGGIEPYTWTMTGGRWPDPGWQFSEHGHLTGPGPWHEQIVVFTVIITDAQGATFEKTFRLAMSDLLIAIPSRDKVGLAWSNRSVSGLLAQAGVTAIGFTVHRGDTLVYEGRNNNFVDQVPTGQAVSYQLGVRLADGTDMPLTGKDVKVLPMSLHKGVIGRQGDPFADRVVRFEPLSQGGYGAGLIPDNVTGPPHGRSTFSPANRPQEVVSLHAAVGSGGTIDLEFTDNIVVFGPGDDFTVFENVFFIGGDPNQRFMEPAIVSVALFPDEWHRLPCDVLPPGDGRPVNVRDPWYYARGLAGRNATTGDDPTAPTRSGGDSFDANSAIGAAGLTWIRFIRIQSTGDAARRDDSGNDLIRHNNDPAFNPLSGRGSSGFDLDAVSAVSY